MSGGSIGAVRARIGAVLGLTILSLAFVLHDLDFDAVRAALARYAWWRAPIALAFYGATLALRTARLRCLVTTSLSYGRTVLIVGAGHLASNVLPLHVGTLVGPYLLDTAGDVPFGDGLAAAIAERVLDLFMLLLLVVLAGLWIALPAEEVLGARVAAPVAILLTTVVALAALAALALAGPPIVARLVERAHRSGSSDGPWILRVAQRLVVGTRTLLARPRATARAAAFTLAWWCTSMAAAAVTIGGFADLPAPSPGVVVVNQIGVVAGGTLVPSPGHVGGFEAGAMGAMLLCGASWDVARAYALVLHATQLGFTITAGLACFAIAGIRVRDVVLRARPSA